jgi:hypothetical protein
MLEHVTFAAGAVTGAAPLRVRPAPITILVGPNNCGKSLALREVEQLLTDQHFDRGGLLVVRDVAYEARAASETAADILRPYLAEEDGHTLTYVNPFRKNGATIGYDRRVIPTIPGDQPQRWGTLLGAVDVARLDGPSRLSLVNVQQSGDLIGPPLNHLLQLFQDEAARLALRRAVHDAFDRYLVIDPTNPGTLRVKLSDRAPTDPVEEQSYDTRARAFHTAARDIGDFSDGVRAYTGLLAALLSLKARILLIDEPDAFLHPPLARKLGHNIARQAADRNLRVFAATHSSEFLMGCIEAGTTVEIVRLTYKAGVASARHLPAEGVRALSQEPLMRSTNVLSALFHDGAVVTESDNDRAFYQEINHRLVAQGEGAASCLFLNAQNKQTVQRIATPLRSLGIPAAAVVDIDVLNKGGAEWGHFLDAGNVPEATRKSLEAWRAQLATSHKDKEAWQALKRGGTATLSADDKSACEDLFKQLAAYGLFVVPVGEVEGWLRALSVAGYKSAWAVAMLDRLGPDPAKEGYVAPGSDDVWDFVRGIAKWLADPLRKGMPS